MKLLTTTGTIREQFENRYPSYQRTFSRLLLAIASFTNAHGWAVFTLVSLWCVWVRFSGLPYHHLDHDELYTFYIAQAPSLGKLLTLARTVDLHPPLSYLFVRLSFALFGVSTWSCRLPSAIAFVLTTAFLFWLLKHMLSPLYGLIAVLFLWSGPYSYNAPIARPYSWLLCFTSLMLLSWYRATESIGRRHWALFGISVGGFGLLLSHVLGVLPFAAILGAELLRLWSVRKSDWRLWLALLTPLVSVITYSPLLKHHSGLLFTPVYRVTPVRLLSCYWEPLRYVSTPLLLIVVFAIAHSCTRQEGNAGSGSTPPKLNLPLSFFLSGLFLVPLAVAILFARTGTAFFERYGVVMLIPVAVAPAMLLAYRTLCNRSYAATVALSLAVLIFLNSSARICLLQQLSSIVPPATAARLLYLTALPPVPEIPDWRPVPAYLEQAALAAPPVSHLDAVQPRLPLVAGTALTFMELDRSEDAELAKRLFLLTNKEGASTIAQDTVFENYEQLKAVFPIRGNVESYCSFIMHHQRFLVLGTYRHPQGWLLRKLDMDGAQLKIVGNYANTLDEHDLYEVTVPANLCRSPQ
jgi:4-amino-4-deoxy-L-arabinose transferase-like glycosyltransferase